MIGFELVIHSIVCTVAIGAPPFCRCFPVTLVSVVYGTRNRTKDGLGMGWGSTTGEGEEVGRRSLGKPWQLDRNKKVLFLFYTTLILDFSGHLPGVWFVTVSFRPQEISVV